MLLQRRETDLFGRKKDTEKTAHGYEEHTNLCELCDEKLLELCADKNEEAFSVLVSRYEKFVYSAVWAELKHTEDAFDVSQEVFIRLYNAAGGFRCESTLKTWLYRMCKNCAYDFMRKNYKHKFISLSASDDGEKDAQTDLPSDVCTESEVIRREQISAVHTAIAKLPEEQREVIVLRELEGMSYTEIAAILGINEGTVKSRISRARQALKIFLEKYR